MGGTCAQCTHPAHTERCGTVCEETDAQWVCTCFITTPYPEETLPGGGASLFGPDEMVRVKLSRSPHYTPLPIGPIVMPDGIDPVSTVRDALIEYRNAELLVGAFSRATLLTHAIAWLSVLEDMEKAE